METIQETRERDAPAKKLGGRRIRVAVQRVSPWSVLKFSLLFYLSLMLVVVFGLVLLYLTLQGLGVVESFQDLMTGLGFGDESGYQVNGGFLFRTVLLIGLVSVVLWSVLTAFVAILYNLIVEIVGGIEVTLSERR